MNVGSAKIAQSSLYSTSSFTSNSSISVPSHSASVTLNSTDGRAAAADAAIASTGPQMVEFWHFVMHFLWQHIEQSLHWTASLSQIFFPQKSHCVARWKWVRTKSCCLELLIETISSSSLSVLAESLQVGGNKNAANSKRTKLGNQIPSRLGQWTLV